MNEKRIEKYINIWLKNIRQEDLKELEKDIDMPLATFVIEILKNLHMKYCDKIIYIPVFLDSYSDYIIAPKNGKYSLEDFLLNRLLRSVTSIIYGNQSKTINSASCYMPEFGKLLIDKNRIQTEITDIRQKRKLVAHELLHGMKTQFYEGDFFDADRYYLLKEELKLFFESEINDFSKKNNVQNYRYKHCGILYQLNLRKNDFYKHSQLDLTDLNEIINESDAIINSNDNYRALSKFAENCYMILKNPESSNTYITNYSFIIERLVDKEILFAGLYIEPEVFYKQFNSLYNSIFKKTFK